MHKIVVERYWKRVKERKSVKDRYPEHVIRAAGLALEGAINESRVEGIFNRLNMARLIEKLKLTAELMEFVSEGVESAARRDTEPWGLTVTTVNQGETDLRLPFSYAEGGGVILGAVDMTDLPPSIKAEGKVYRLVDVENNHNRPPQDHPVAVYRRSNGDE